MSNATKTIKLNDETVILLMYYFADCTEFIKDFSILNPKQCNYLNLVICYLKYYY